MLVLQNRNSMDMKYSPFIRIGGEENMVSFFIYFFRDVAKQGFWISGIFLLYNCDFSHWYEYFMMGILNHMVIWSFDGGIYLFPYFVKGRALFIWHWFNFVFPHFLTFRSIFYVLVGCVFFISLLFQIR